LEILWSNKFNDNVRNTSEEYDTLFAYVLNVLMGAILGLEI